MISWETVVLTGIYNTWEVNNTPLMLYNNFSLNDNDLEQLKYDIINEYDSLLFLLKRLKIKGGLKKIEKRFGISRGGLENLDGYTAVILWNKFKKTKKKEYLETLLAYNNEDVINLEFLLYRAYNLLIEKEHCITSPLEFPRKKVKNPFQANRRVVDEILGGKSKLYN